MVSLSTLVAFAIVSLSMVCSPGPNMIYLISRSITQGRMAGFISLLGIMLGFVIYIIATMFGLTVLFVAVPAVYEAVKWAGAAYLLWLAWNSIKPGATSIMEPRMISNEPPRKLFLRGLMTNLLNPKIAILYVSLLPQFEDPEKGSLLFQGAVLGLTQITVSFIVNLVIVCTASKIAKWFGTRPTWLQSTALAYGKCFNGACCTSCF